MLKRPISIASALILVACSSIPTVASGMDLQKTLQLGPSELVLNGSGARKSTLLKLYTGGLYLPNRTNDAASIIEADAPMAITIKITSKFVSQQRMVAALETGFENSTNGQTTAIANEINQFKSCFNEAITMGDTYIIAYHPNSGVLVYKNNVKQGVVKGFAFKKALFGIWLGANPADQDLKSGLLGQ